MAVKDYGTPNKGRQLMFKGKDQTQGLDDKTNYGNNQFIELSDGDPNASTRLAVHLILGVGAPGTLYTNAPLGSLYINTSAGTLYTKIASLAAVGDWALVTAVAVV